MAPSVAISLVSMGAIDVVMVVVSVLVFVGAGDVNKTLSPLVNSRFPVNMEVSTYVSLVEITSVDVSTPTVVDHDGFNGPAFAVMAAPSTAAAAKITERTSWRDIFKSNQSGAIKCKRWC